MDKKWDICEGVLRGKRNKVDGSWKFFEAVTLSAARGEEISLLYASNLTEARRTTSKREARLLELYKGNRRHIHTTTSFNESGWVGDLVDGAVGQFLLDEFNIDLDGLSPKQRRQLQQDILSIGASYLTKAKQRAKSDLKETQRLLEQLKKQQPGIEKLSRGFRSMAHFSPFAAPDETLAQLIFELSENEKAIQENLDGLGRDKSNISSINLCSNAIDIFLRWSDGNAPTDQRGIRYSNDNDRLKVLSKIEPDEGANLPARFDSPLGEFLEKTKASLLASGVEIWRFGVHEPSRNALARHQKRQQFLG